MPLASCAHAVGVHLSGLSGRGCLYTHIALPMAYLRLLGPLAEAPSILKLLTQLGLT